MTKAEISSFALLQAFAFLLFSSTSAQLHFNFNSITLQPVSIPPFTVGPGTIIPPIEVPYPAIPFISLPDKKKEIETSGGGKDWMFWGSVKIYGEKEVVDEKSKGEKEILNEKSKG